MGSARHLKGLSSEQLSDFVSANLPSLVEDEVLGILDNPFATPQICSTIAQSPRLTAFYRVRVRLAGHRQTPQTHAVKLVHYLYWADLLRLSVDVTVPAPVRRAIDTQLLARVVKLALGEKITSARMCGAALIKHFLFEPDPRVFEALLVNRRLREDDVIHLCNSAVAGAEKLRMVAADSRWSFRYAVRKALVLNPSTPRSVAASQLRHLSRRDLREIHENPATSTYILRCIERAEQGRRDDDAPARG